MENDTVIIRFSGEIGIKSDWTRRTYERQLLKNLKLALKTQNLKPATTRHMRGRIYVKTNQPQETAEALTRVFGISSVSPAKQTTSDKAAITETALVAAQAAIKDHSSFAVRCHRVGTHPYTSMDLCRDLGSDIMDALETRSPTVNLTSPDVTLTVEVRDREAYVYAETLQGSGGFPLGTQAKTVCLLSGGIDSPVASWLVMKRGSPTVPLYVDNAPFTDETTKQRAVETARKLKEWSAGYITQIYIVPNGENMRTFMEQTPVRFTCLMCKRMMYRIAEQVAEKEDAYGIVTGEAIGEQASQTMQNLYAIDQAATKYPIHRPLLGFDKTETEAIARRIGTLQISTAKAKACTANPSQPATQAKLQAILDAEAQLDIADMVEKAVEKAEVLQL